MPLTLKALRAKDYSENPQTLGEHLKKRRRELGLLQREAAERMGILTETYGNWEKDKSKPVAS
jgi:DNA-binding XRE family transcriptional regulator